jgi:murein DD-endopeptidase MepM/ murein hydrolase activator NlpD
MNNHKKEINLIIFLTLLIFIFIPFIKTNATTKDVIADPISSALSRVTKKPFGIKVSPGHSPVTPEKFSGYHTGVDFETTVAEQNIDVPVYALCDGNLLEKKTATGYGGVVVQKCTLSGQIVTIIYGHLKLSSVSAKIGAKLQAGTQIGILGKAYSTETDGERKHLHLGIHKGSSINILGYVKYKSSLKDWLDVTKYLSAKSQTTK